MENNNVSEHCLSAYYRACVHRSLSWYFVAILKSYEHVAFDRTFDIEQSIFEFFVPRDMESTFLALMHKMEQEGIIKDLHKYPNRLTDPRETV